MKKFIMMAGLPGSGKSTMAKERSVKENAVLHSSDDLREELLGNVDNQNRNDLLFQELHKRIRRDLAQGRSVVYDATNLGYKKRKAFLEGLELEGLETDCHKECCFAATPYEKCLSRNAGRSRKVPETVIENMYKGIFVPQYFEGWDHIEISFEGDDSQADLDDLFEELDAISQDNPHHTLTIGGHCKKCMACVKELGADDILAMAALLHDIGKKFTKRFADSKGNPTDVAHFYGHQNVSAYLSLFYLRQLQPEKMLEIAKYIQWHMQPANIPTEKTKNKWVRLLGEEFYTNLLKLHEADVKAK